MRSIIVIAYQLHYSHGSECAVAWDYINHMSRNNELTVLYGSSAGHHDIGNTHEMEQYCSSHTIPNVTFIPVKPSFVSKNWGYGILGSHKFYKEYKKWHLDVFRQVSNLISREHYDIIHFLGPIGYHEPGFLYKLPIPYIWGPIGGMVTVPPRLLLKEDVVCNGLSGTRLIIKSILKKVRLFTNGRVKKAMRSADVLISCTTLNINTIEKAIGKKHHSVISYLPEICINELHELNVCKFNAPVINMIVVGRLDVGKAPMIILEALTKLGKELDHLHVNFLGGGPLMVKCRAFVEQNGLEKVVTLHGAVERTEVFKMMENSQLMLLSTLSDANTTVVFEAMSHAVPTLCLDHCGMHDTIKENIGIKIPIGSWDDVVNNIAKELKLIVEKPERLKILAENLLHERNEYTWSRRVEKIEEYYALAEKQFKNRKN